jgi:hypothetical protein
MGNKTLFRYEEPKEVGEHKIKKIKKTEKGIKFKTTEGKILVENVEDKETYTEEELLNLLPE